MLLILPLVRLDTGRPWTADIGQLRTQTRTAFRCMRMPKYLCPNISVYDVSAYKLNGISKKYHHRIVKSNEI